ncbi:MAG: hypothetical protein HY292_01505 [Planctomycetes bacterium]|nr:hypothetical protein [Planctomycetota bacterium]
MIKKKSADHSKKPYVRLIGRRGDIKIYSVDGAYVRTKIDEEFTNFGQHYRFHFIPEDEFWLDKEGSPDEARFFIDHLLVEHRLMKHKTSYDEAIRRADLAERAERRRSRDMSKAMHGGALPDPKTVHRRLLKALESGVKVWLVDGRLVRSAFDIDFTEGGHEHVYEFVPRNEVWIDDDVTQVERGFVILHELHERNLMAKGMSYSKAHEDSSKIEYHCRHHPDELHDALAEEGWE